MDGVTWSSDCIPNVICAVGTRQLQKPQSSLSFMFLPSGPSLCSLPPPKGCKLYSHYQILPSVKWEAGFLLGKTFVEINMAYQKCFCPEASLKAVFNSLSVLRKPPLSVSKWLRPHYVQASIKAVKLFFGLWGREVSIWFAAPCQLIQDQPGDDTWTRPLLSVMLAFYRKVLCTKEGPSDSSYTFPSTLCISDCPVWWYCHMGYVGNITDTW